MLGACSGKRGDSSGECNTSVGIPVAASGTVLSEKAVIAGATHQATYVPWRILAWDGKCLKGKVQGQCK